MNKTEENKDERDRRIRMNEIEENKDERDRKNRMSTFGSTRLKSLNAKFTWRILSSTVCSICSPSYSLSIEIIVYSRK